MQCLTISKHLSSRTSPIASSLSARYIGGTKAQMPTKSKIRTNEKIVAPQLADKIGAPHAISNIRPLRLHVPDEETDLHKKYRLLREETQVWNHKFWLTHNQEFAEAKEKFIKKTLEGKKNIELKKNLTNEEMSEFYKQFLNDKWMSHLRYNFEWQKRNFKIAALSMAVAAQKMIKKD